jgi:uncharacterized integral membrane protein
MFLIKTVFGTAVLLLLVMIGLNNRAPVDFSLPPLVSSVVHQPAALMYMLFFAVGLVSGAILSLGTRKKKQS